MIAVGHELVNRRGDRVRLIDLGARIASLRLAIGGTTRHVVLGYPTTADFATDTYYMGAVAGRCCNRIGGSRFAIEGVEYRLPPNDGRNHLHGGPRGFSARHWQRAPGAGSQSVDFNLLSEDGDQGYPGNLSVSVSYTWNDERELRIRYRATTDAPTHVNLTSHAYFNLDANKRDMLGHDVRVAGSQFTAVDAQLIPTGDLVPVAASHFDLRERTRIGRVVASAPTQHGCAGGIDLNYVLDSGRPAAELWSSDGTLCMSVETSYPGLQLYTGHHLGPPWQPFAGVCFEAQYFPDSPNRPGFPSTLLLPGREYDEFVSYRFSAD